MEYVHLLFNICNTGSYCPLKSLSSFFARGAPAFGGPGFDSQLQSPGIRPPNCGEGMHMLMFLKMLGIQ
nr:flowering time control protein FCA-like isoform X2 [Tanacetum cinerariifolium]